MRKFFFLDNYDDDDDADGLSGKIISHLNFEGLLNSCH
jgi:hypothetical protein